MELDPNEFKFLQDNGWCQEKEDWSQFSESCGILDLEHVQDFEDFPITYLGLYFELCYGDFQLIFHKNHIIGIKLHLDNEIPPSIKYLKKLKMLVLYGAFNYYDDHHHHGQSEISFFKDIFSKIALLPNLRYLTIENSRIREIPDLAKMFPKLRELKLPGTLLKTTPDWLYKFASKIPQTRYLISIGVNKEEAEVLRFLGILSTSFGLHEEWDDLSGYSIDNSGHVIKLKLGYDYASSPHFEAFPYFPEEICELKYLEKLYINVENIIYSEEHKCFFPNKEKADAWIPESIVQLESLQYLCTNAKYSESLSPYLKSLERFIDDVYEGEAQDSTFFT